MTLSIAEAEGLEEICNFIVFCYVEAWFTAGDSSSAPRNDLEFVSRVREFSLINSAVSRNVQEKMCSHLWYLSEELIPLAIFDSGLPNRVRRSIADSIRYNVSKQKYGKRLLMSPEDIASTSLSKLGNQNSHKFFKILGIEPKFLDLPVKVWETNEQYQMGKSLVESLTVTNDHAERAVKLMQDYNNYITRSEENYQDLLICVSEHRKTLPIVNKTMLIEKYKPTHLKN